MRDFQFQKLDGQLRLLGPIVQEYNDWVETLGDEEIYVATFRRASSNKTTAQLRYYFGVVVPDVIAGLIELGWTDVGYREFLGTVVPMEVNTQNVDELLKQVYSIDTGEDKPSKTRMSKEAMTRFLDSIKEWCRDNDIYVREPREKGE